MQTRVWSTEWPSIGHAALLNAGDPMIVFHLAFHCTEGDIASAMDRHVVKVTGDNVGSTGE